MAFALSSKSAAAVVSRAASKPAPAVVRAGVRSSAKARRNLVVSNVAAPAKEQWNVNIHGPGPNSDRAGLPQLISKEQVEALEAELDQGASIAALRRFNDALRNIPADRWESVLRPVFNELCFNLESFNPAFTSCLLMVQRTIGVSDYVRRDLALKNLIQPLAGEYGMHNGQPQLKTHRELFSDFFTSLFGYELQALLADSPAPTAAQQLFASMLRDISTAGGREAEHAAIGHNAVLNMVPSEHVPLLRSAMADHDRDFAAFYNHVADLIEQGCSA
ncbi:hypothetical protein GPECTOR_15g498 [Gonium pectorale]|uniref:Uncharacterized protein n=1 Tax=Gonium pectorale TaxID=33097 RepID=A0A150GM19_GONPE|nr:hypothetical protein GPECTOR_15g498 [Gonium pectorale]|eukprot:KXZ50812.1 hypothetical protein GPECTOR_15g498 [Gonium pectorale]